MLRCPVVLLVLAILLWSRLIGTSFLRNYWGVLALFLSALTLFASYNTSSVLHSLLNTMFDELKMRFPAMEGTNVRSEILESLVLLHMILMLLSSLYQMFGDGPKEKPPAEPLSPEEEPETETNPKSKQSLEEQVFIESSQDTKPLSIEQPDSSARTGQHVH